MNIKHFVFLAILLALPQVSSAHQPRIVSVEETRVSDPEISQAFYGELAGEPQRFLIGSDKSFRLYVGLLVPDNENSRTDISAGVYRFQGDEKKLVSFLNGETADWTPFFEKFSRDRYLWGPEFKVPGSEKGEALKGRTVPAGNYLIEVKSPDNQGSIPWSSEMRRNSLWVNS